MHEVRKMSKQTALVSFCIALTVSACAANRATHEWLNGVLWAQTSVEFQVSVNQSFNTAKENIQKALNDPDWTAALEQTDGYQGLKPAVIVDVDETVLDNYPFEARLVKEGIGFDYKLWQAWVNESRADGMPGAKSFIQYVKAKGIKVFYVTNRVLEAPTVKNIKMELDPQVTPDDVLCKNEKTDWGSDKTSRRAFIARQYRILLLIGDDYNDFTFLGKVSPEERISNTRNHQQYWGKQWIIISNPVYGHWERALYDYDYKLSDEDKLKAKINYLNTK
jgi:acid phosphatase